MKSKLPDWKGMKQGYGSRSKWNTLKKTDLPKKRKRDLDPDNDKKSYPNGVIPFVFITLVFIIVLICVFSIIPAPDEGGAAYRADNWYNLLFYVSGIPFCLSVLWALGRAGLSSTARFGMMKVGRQIRWLNLRTKVRQKLDLDFALNDVHSFQDWEQYLKDRKFFTRKWFYITIGVYSSLFVVITILMLAMNGYHKDY